MGKKQAVIIFSTAYLPLIGGAELAVKEITDRIHNLDFFIITSRMNRAFPRNERIGNAEVYRIGVGIPLVDKLLSIFWGARVARQLAKKYDVICFWSIMVTFTCLAPIFLRMARLHRNVPIVLTLQEGDSPAHIRRARFGLIGLSWRFVLRFADHAQVISNYLADMARQYGYKGEISIVPNGANIEKFKVHPVIRQGAPSNDGANIVITTSRLVYKNGIDTLIEAIAKVKERVPDIQCWILGDGEERKNYSLLVTRYSLQNNVTFFGSVPYEKVPHYLAQADVFVRPSRSEGLGTAFLEAMAAGLPIIGTPAGGIPDFLTDNETGLFARADDANDLAEKIERLLKDDGMRERLARNGRRLVEERYDWDHIAPAMNEMFRKTREKAISRNGKHTQFPRVVIATGIYPPDIGGPATYSHIVAEEFHARGINVTVVTYGAINEIESRKNSYESYEIRSRKIYKISRRLPKGLRHFFYFFAVLWHGRHADIIYAQQPVSEGLPAMIAAKVLRKKFVLKVVGDYAWEQGVQRFGVKDSLDDFLLARTRQAGGQKKYGGFTLRSLSGGGRLEFLRAVESFVARRADRIIVPSNYLASVVAQWGVAQDRIAVISNAVEIPHGLPNKEEARRALGILEDEKIILSAGRLVPWKGFTALIESMKEIIRQEPNAKLVIVGSGPDQSKLESRIMNYELGHNVRLIGSLSHENILQYLRAADVFVLNTAYEGFSHQLIEAMAIGAPVITTMAGGNAEIVRDGENALAVPYNDGEKMTRAILRVLREDALQKMLVENGRKIAAQFTKERMVDETLRILQKIKKIIEVEPR